MGFCELLGIVTFVYYLFYLIYPWFLDCDINLSIKETFGKPIDTLHGKVVWITGASSGIGEHLAYALAKVNCKLILSARRLNELNKVKENCIKVSTNLRENDIEVLVMDVCDTSAHEDLVKHVISKFGKLDILVNNAGRSQRAIWENIELSVDREMFDLNTFSIISLSRAAYKYFSNVGQGHLVVTSSFAGIIGIPFSGTYTGSKHALHGYFESLRTEKMDKNISITMVCPGATQTPFLSQAFTEKSGEKYGKDAEIASNKISAERCGHLIAVGIANKVNECWIAHSTALQLVYLAKYYPNLARIIMLILGPNFLQRLRDNKVVVNQK